MSFEIKKISNDRLGTHYGIFAGETLIHYEFSRSSAESILTKLQDGKTLEEALVVPPTRIKARLVKSQITLVEEKNSKTILQSLKSSVQRTEYDPALYRKIANLRVNEIVQVTNRKGYKSTIHITNIVKLTWHQLQLLVSGGSSKFEKQYLLYKQYLTTHSSNNVLRGLSLSRSESTEIQEYIDIFEANGFSKHTQVNDHITEHGLWDRFPTIRSLNDHGKNKNIKGIEPKYFDIVCSILNISGEGGRPLDNFKKY